MTHHRTARVSGHWIGTLWGKHLISRTVSTGLFFCPHEQAERAYSGKRVRMWHIVLSVPAFPGRVVGEYVECFSCGDTYHPRIVGSTHPAIRTEQAS
jgi:hypothetical protein